MAPRRYPMPRIVDLSHPLEAGQLSFPGDPEFRVTPRDAVDSVGYNITELEFGTHQGTHLDAPYHFFDDGRTIDQIPLDRFYGPARLIDFAPGGFVPAGTPLTAAMFEESAGALYAGAKAIYRTGWDRLWGRPEFFEDPPSLTLEAARYLASRRIGLLGMDTPTPSAEWLECHRILLARGVEIVIVESLTNLDQLPPRFTFAAFPLNIRGRDGSPVRAVAIVDDETVESG
ncbi:MAG: cyclase family protein [Bryobacteraceae bacterium]|nr:cyclase family protein [Bryobacteraceae bacterium]